MASMFVVPPIGVQAERQSSSTAQACYDRRRPEAGSVVISGTALGLPGADRAVMDPGNVERLLRGEHCFTPIPPELRQAIFDKHILRLIKDSDGSGRFEPLDQMQDVIKLAARPGRFDLTAEYGVPPDRVEALDITSQLAMAAGLEALREAGIPLLQTYRPLRSGKHLPDRFVLPLSLRDETGIIFASIFPGLDRFHDELRRYYEHMGREVRLRELERCLQAIQDPGARRVLKEAIDRVEADLRSKPYRFDRRFLFRVLSMGHSQLAEVLGARGPNAQVNIACASTTQGIALAEDWIHCGRCRRVLVVAADCVTGDNMLEWIGSGFQAVGAAATDEQVQDAALPFDRRRHGLLLGMGACAFLVESEDAVRERGMRGLVEVLGTEQRNSAFHGTRLDPIHIAQVMNDLIGAAEARFHLDRRAMASETVYVSHETYTPARGGSAAAEVAALRETFGEAAQQIVVTNTKGFTGHPMGVGIEDIMAVKILERGFVPPVANFQEPDPELGALRLSRGGPFPARYAIHTAAGFGSQLAITLFRRIPRAEARLVDPVRYQRWLDEVSGYDSAETEVVMRTLRVKSEGPPARSPSPSVWQMGSGPSLRAEWEEGESTPSDRAPEASRPDPVAERVFCIVAARAGYPPDMLSLDLDLEVDLGLDTARRAETLSEIRSAFGIPASDDLRLSHYPTLATLVRFVRDRRVLQSAS